MKKIKRPTSWLTKRVRRGFRSYPIATVAFSGPKAPTAIRARAVQRMCHRSHLSSGPAWKNRGAHHYGPVSSVRGDLKMTILGESPKAAPDIPGTTGQTSRPFTQSEFRRDPRIDRVLEFIAACPTEVTLESAAAVVWISPSRLRHLSSRMSDGLSTDTSSKLGLSERAIY